MAGSASSSHDVATGRWVPTCCRASSSARGPKRRASAPGAGFVCGDIRSLASPPEIDGAICPRRGHARWWWPAGPCRCEVAAARPQRKSFPAPWFRIQDTRWFPAQRLLRGPVPPHGPGFVTKGSSTVNVGNLPAARMGDKVFEACGGQDSIATGCPAVNIGDGGSGGCS